mmetsp:Transcript_12631/g.18567  ORF Transcript_12631/g.18567 Transcript_12631/m.18567 type:complete len:486 (-) Transcript_12631:327-1784(-)
MMIITRSLMFISVTAFLGANMSLILCFKQEDLVALESSSAAMMGAILTEPQQKETNTTSDITLATNSEETQSTKQVPSQLSNETRIRFETPATTTFQDVCITISKNSTTNSSEVQLFSSPDTSILPINGFVKKRRNVQGDKFDTTQNATWEEWNQFRRNAVYVEEDTLWLDDCQDCQNAGHCLNDIVFSVANHMSQYLKQSSSFTRFIRGSPNRGIVSCSDNESVCCDMMSTRFGLIRPESAILPSSSSDVESSAICFASLTFPKLARHRHYHRGRTKKSDVALQELHQRTFDALPSTTGTAWNHSSLAEKHIIVLDRSDATTRRLANASVLADLLESEYENVTVHRAISEHWASYNSTQQAQVFNDYPYIISPHGAQLVNLFHTRPQTRVLEIQCEVQYSRWRMHEQWYADFAPVIDIDFKVFVEVEGCKDADGNLHPFYNPPDIDFKMNFTRLLEESAAHFGLTKKKKTNRSSNMNMKLEYSS